jgi:hypothetical protein
MWRKTYRPQSSSASLIPRQTKAAGSGGRPFDHALDKWSPGIAGTGAPAVAVLAASRQYDSARLKPRSSDLAAPILLRLACDGGSLSRPSNALWPRACGHRMPRPCLSDWRTLHVDGFRLHPLVRPRGYAPSTNKGSPFCVKSASGTTLNGLASPPTEPNNVQNQRRAAELERYLVLSCNE